MDLISLPCQNTSLISLDQTRTAKGFAILSIFFFLFIIPVERLASRETHLVQQRTILAWQWLITYSIQGQEVPAYLRANS
jgi:hypothetical protein